jgi:flagellar biosynthetic protein FliO
MLETPSPGPQAGLQFNSATGAQTPESTVVLVVVLLLVFGAAYFVSKFVANKARGFSRTKYLRIVDNMAFGKDKSIMLVETKGKAYLIGVTAHAMTLLEKMDTSEVQPFAEDKKAGAQPQSGKSTARKAAAWLQKMASAPGELRRAQQNMRPAERDERSPTSRKKSKEHGAQPQQQHAYGAGHTPPGAETEYTQQQADDLSRMLESIHKRKARLDDKNDA